MSKSRARKTGTSATGKRLQTVGLFVTLLVVAVLVGSLAAGLMRGRSGAAATAGSHGVTETATEPGGANKLGAATDPGAAARPAGRVRVEVLNASGVPGLAAKGRTVLRDHGFDVVYVGNANGYEPDTSLVLDRVGRMELARSVADQMAIPRVYPRPDSNVFVDVTVVLGKDWSSMNDSVEVEQ
ncbi:LytR C-terminal domain-containing protein [Longimicrobium sp.]|uniref:LytR C-terminal domain-containing protein n=1 Tax=Longimicrobium sp. TaxID=2029185 RepID=UPI003B3B409C